MIERQTFFRKKGKNTIVPAHRASWQTSGEWCMIWKYKILWMSQKRCAGVSFLECSPVSQSLQNRCKNKTIKETMISDESVILSSRLF